MIEHFGIGPFFAASWNKISAGDAGRAEHMETGLGPGDDVAFSGGGDSAHHARAGCAGGDAEGGGPGPLLPGAGNADERLEGGNLSTFP